MSPCPTKIYVKAWKFRIFDATEGYRVKYASVKSACYQWGPWFCVLYPILFQTWPELQAPSTTQQSILVLGLVLISSGDGGPLQSGCLVSVLLASASLHSLTKKVLRCHAKKTHLVLQICSKSQPTTTCDCDSVSVCQRSIANAVLWALLHCDMIAQCYKEVHYQYV